MAIDGLTLTHIKRELQERLTGGWIRKIYQPRAELITINVWNGDNYRLLLSCDDDFRVQLTDVEFKHPQNPPPFSMLLRKHLSGGKLSRVTQVGVDRVMKFVVTHRGESSGKDDEYVEVELVVELFGRYSNVILVQEGKILGVLQENTRRNPPLKTGSRYEFPADSGKDDPFQLRREKFAGYFESGGKVWRELMANVDGIGPTLAKEVAGRADVSPDLKDPSKIEVGRLWGAARDLFCEIKGKRVNPLVYQKDGNTVEFAPVHLVQYGDKNEIEFNSWKDALDYYYREKELSYSTDRLDENLREILEDELERVSGAIKNVDEQLEQAENKERYKELGDLILANLKGIEKGKKEAEVEDLYNEGENVRIELDPSLSPEDNAQEYYKKYKKLKRGEKKLRRRKKGLQAERRFLSGELEDLNEAETEGEIISIERTLIEKGYVEEETEDEAEDRSKPREYWFKGYKVMVGRNARQNDELVRKANRDDLWFHVRNYAGAHVIIVTDGRPDSVPEDVIVKAAQLAAYNSKAKNSTKAMVSYTQAKYANKPKGAKPGLVRITNEKTIAVNPQEVIS
ncbi:MAG: Rqc2 family fibronectin-binding protein [Candidatus Bipolaricaulota bacterium]